MCKDDENQARVKIVLVSGIPGTGVPAALEKLATWMKSDSEASLKHWRVHQKFEDLLVEQYNADNPDGRVRNLIHLLNTPKPVLRALWQKTMSRLRDSLNEIASSTDVVLLPIHLVWFHQYHREHLNVLDMRLISKQLKPHKICHVLCLIDDVYDTYARLRQPGKLYDRQSSRLSPQDAKRGHALIRHLAILDWRANEVAESESVASHVQVPFTLLAVKHTCKVAYWCLEGIDQAYLSHAITEVRRLERSEFTNNQVLAKTFKDSLRDFQETLSKRTAVLQPTCIDELRLVEHRNGAALATRFYPRECYVDSLFVDDGCNDDEVIYDDLQDKDGPPSETDVSIARELSDILKRSIVQQVSSRDLALVTQSGHLIVYRPRFHGSLPSGVKEEIKYFEQITKLKGRKDRAIVFLDSKEDEAEFVPRQFLEAVIINSRVMRLETELSIELIVDYHALISDNTRDTVLLAISSDSLDDIRGAITCVLKDLGLRGKWSLSEDVSPDPLISAHTFTDFSQKMDEFLRTFVNAATPFENRWPYNGRHTVWIDGMNSNELCDAIMNLIKDWEK